MHKIIKVVFDTNHIISAILSAKGASAKLIHWMTRKEDYFKLLLSQPIWDEYCYVANWLIPISKQMEKDRVLTVLKEQSEWIETTTKLNVCKDTSDNCFLECAMDGHADYLVTKNIRHFPQKQYSGTKILRIREFLILLETRENKQEESIKF